MEHDALTTLELFVRVAVALAIGMLIGLERGLHQRHERDRAGVEASTGTRTFGLLGLLGGICALLADALGAIVLGLSFLAPTALLITWYVVTSARDRDYGITTVVAGLVSFALGALAVGGHLAVAASAAVVTAFLLWLKPRLHDWEARIERHDLVATLKFLLISVVMLPVLPDRGFGPWRAFNPYEIWWMVVLIAGISFVGYIAIALVGAKRGIGVTGIAGGLASSTATTLHLARIARRDTALTAMASAGILLAAGTLYPRVLLVVAVLHVELVPMLLPAFAVMSAVCFGAAFVLMRRPAPEREDPRQTLANPFELAPAVKFGALLAAIMLLARALEAWLGERGIYMLAAVSGIADVDALTLSMARMAKVDLTAAVAGYAILIAVIVNTSVKGILAVVVGGAGMLRTATITLLAAGALGALAVLIPYAVS